MIGCLCVFAATIASNKEQESLPHPRALLSLPPGMACTRILMASGALARRGVALAPVVTRSANCVLQMAALPSWAPSSQLSTATTSEETPEDAPGYTVEDVDMGKDENLRVVWYKQKNVPGSVKKLNVVARQVSDDSNFGIIMSLTST